MIHIQGWVENGNTKVSVSGLLSTTLTQKSFPLSTVTVYNAGTIVVATIYSDNNGTSLGNPFTANSDGTWGFYAAPGQYDVVFSGTGIPAPFTIFAIGESISTLLGPSYVSACDNTITLGDASQKIAAAIALLPSTGGTVDARCLFGNQAWSTDPFVGLAPTKPVYLLLGIGTTNISVNVTWPRNVTIAFSQGSILSTSGVTLTIKGQIAADLYKIFAGTTPPSMAGAGPYAYPEWFGALADGVTDDWLAIQTAEDSLISGGLLNTTGLAPVGTVQFSNGTYVTSQPISTCHFDGCPGNVSRGIPAGTVNACVNIRGPARGTAQILSHASIDMFQMFNWACPSSVDDLMIVSDGVSVGIRVRGNQTSIRRNWFLVNNAVVIETTATIDTGATILDENVCDSTQLGGFPGCLVVTQSGGGTGNPSPNYIQISNQHCFGGAWCLQSDRIYDSVITNMSHDSPGTYLISLTNATNIAMSGIEGRGAPINQNPSEHGIEIIDSTNVTIASVILRNFPASAVFVQNSTGIVISSFAFTDNVQNVAPSNPYDVAFLRSDVVLKGGTITNNTGHSTRAIHFDGVGDGNYVLDGIIIRGTVFNGTLIEGVAGAGSIQSASLNNISSDSPWSSGSSILVGGVVGGLNVTNINLANIGVPTTWLESTYVFTSQCISNNNVNGGSQILLNGVPFGAYTSGCFTGAVRLTQSEVAGIDNSGTLLNSGSATFGSTVTFDGATTVVSARFQTGRGADLTAANNLTLGTDGNFFPVNGSTQINCIAIANWQNGGGPVILKFNGTPTLKYNQACGGGFAPLILASAGDFVAANNSTITLYLVDSGEWIETARKA